MKKNITRRNSEQVLKDVNNLLNLSVRAKSIEHLAKLAELTVSQLNTTIKKMTEDQKEIFYKNLEESAKNKKSYVIDASITGRNDIDDVLSSLEERKVILTSTTIEELENLKGANDTPARGARHIANNALLNQDIYETVMIEDINPKRRDDNILQYCKDNKDNVILVADDNVMLLRALVRGIEIKKYPLDNEKEYGVTKLQSAYMEDEKLYIETVKRPFYSCIVDSDGIEYSKHGFKVELKNDDMVYIITRNKSSYYTFAHYQVIKTTSDNNVKIINHFRFNNLEECKTLINKRYKTLIKDFIYNEKS